MKVLIVSEGIHELGGVVPDDHGDDGDRAGALQALVDRILTGDNEFIQRAFRSRDVEVTAMPGKGGKLLKRMLLWLRRAEQLECHAVILLIDEDGDASRQPDVDAAQGTIGLPIPRACGLAIREFDAWILADERALTAALGCPVACQPAPEGIRDPKRTFADLHAASSCTDRRREVYATVLGEARIDLLAKRCPRGFAPFGERVRGLRTVP